MNAWLLAANDFAESWFPILWRACWQGGLFVIGLWLVCRIFPRLPAASRHWLWWLACIQFVVRLAIASPVSLPILRSADPPSVVYSAPINAVADETPVYTAIQTVRAEPLPIPPPARPAWELIVLSAWAIGIGAFAVSSVRRLIRTHRLVANAEPVSDSEATRMVDDLSSLIGVRPPRLRRSAEAPCPMLAGWLTPTIVLPTDTNLGEELRMAISHELVHLKRGDLWLATVRSGATAIFFFHPLAWLAAREADLSCEEACDAAALRLSGASPAAYAKLLLDTARSRVSMAAMGTAFSYRLLHRRILMLNATEPASRPYARRLFQLLVPLGLLCAVPWTVTAQTSAKKATKAKVAVARHKAHKRVAAKAAVKAKLAVAPRAPTFMAIATAPVLPAGTHVRLALVPVGGPAVAPPNKAETVTPPAGVYGVAMAPPSLAGTSGLTVAPVRGHRSGIAGTPPAAASAPGLSYSTGTTIASPAAAGVGLSAPMKASSRTVGSTQPAPTAFAGSTMPASAVGTVEETANPMDVSVQFTHVELSQALVVLFSKTKTNFVIDADVKDDVITCGLSHVTIDDAIQAMLKGTHQKLTYRVERNVYYIVPRESGN